jgi:hypothetical protein
VNTYDGNNNISAYIFRQPRHNEYEKGIASSVIVLLMITTPSRPNTVIGGLIEASAERQR